MKFVRGTTEVAIQTVYERIAAGLTARQRVLWLTSGGSNIALQVEVMNRLRQMNSDNLDQLAILPMDERYGPMGHADSNSEALRQAGFDPGSAIWIDVLAQGTPFEDTISHYTHIADTMLQNAQLIVGQFGMGDDMHIAGIKPASPATQPAENSVVGYIWSDYERMTLSAESLRRIDSAYLPAFGAGKQAALEQLQVNKLPFEQMPAKLLYDIAETYVYNDFITSEG